MEKGDDPNPVLCPFIFKRGTWWKRKLSPNVTSEEIAEKRCRSVEACSKSRTMENMDEVKLEKVIEKKNGKAEQEMPPTDIENLMAEPIFFKHEPAPPLNEDEAVNESVLGLPLWSEEEPSQSENFVPAPVFVKCEPAPQLTEDEALNENFIPAPVFVKCEAAPQLTEDEAVNENFIPAPVFVKCEAAPQLTEDEAVNENFIPAPVFVKCEAASRLNED